MSKLIDFIVIGFPKCGTTQLVKQLDRHDNIHILRRDKKQHNNEFEIHFFDDPQKSINWLHSLASREKFVLNGYKTSNYIFNKNILKQIRGYNETIKPIVCIRLIKHSAYSWFKMHRNIASSPKRHLRHPINRDESTRKELLNMDLNSYIEKYRHFLDYSNYLESAIDVFGAENIFIIYQDELALKPKELLARLCTLLEIDNFKNDQIDFIEASLVQKWQTYNDLIDSQLSTKSKNLIQIYQKNLDSLVASIPYNSLLSMKLDVQGKRLN